VPFRCLFGFCKKKFRRKKALFQVVYKNYRRYCGSFLNPCCCSSMQLIEQQHGRWLLGQSAIAANERRSVLCTASECAATRRAKVAQSPSSPKWGRGGRKPPTSLFFHLRSKVERGGSGRSPANKEINILLKLRNLKTEFA
jgi:hypothetical protein